ncbi:unnamed protein product [Cuscuta campestris]|uniref:Uncharacterized protein n=1 Tax=Cuscuta campestris TaxID=132261 RepID=A0A484K3G6_9ASTE|nr:unnamed protein product [Cuscuta campestris]
MALLTWDQSLGVSNPLTNVTTFAAATAFAFTAKLEPTLGASKTKFLKKCVIFPNKCISLKPITSISQELIANVRNPRFGTSLRYSQNQSHLNVKVCICQQSTIPLWQ